MYENQTFEVILKRMLENVPSTIDKREGSVMYDALAPAAAELAKAYIELDWMYEQMFADTANREYLIRRCAERGFSPTKATKAILKGEFNIDISIGTRFSLDTLNYTVLSKISTGVYQMECETEGSQGNQYFGSMTPISYIKGLTKAELTELLIPGEDEEGTEHLRKRYFNSLKAQAYGGNLADYKEKVNTLAGVGGVKVYPAWDGGGTVKLVILDSNYGVPSDALVHTVKEEIDPELNTGKGYGIAPIGHVVTVQAVKEEMLNFRINLTFQSGYNFEICQEELEEAVDRYLLTLNQMWEDVEQLVVRVSKLESLFLDVEGVLDAYDLMINEVAGNYVASSDAIVKRGGFVGA